MRTAEDSSGTVLHRLIQEQLRYGNLTDNRALLAIQQQAMRVGTGSPRSSLESLTQEECHIVQHSTRQEPQGQEHQGDFTHSENLLHRLQRMQLNGEALPSYEEAKAQSQLLAGHRRQQLPTDSGPNLPTETHPNSTQGRTHQDLHSNTLKDLKHEHVRSLSERLMQLSLERNGPKAPTTMSSSHSFPQLSKRHKLPVVTGCQGHIQSVEHCGPPPEYPFHTKAAALIHPHSQQHLNDEGLTPCSDRQHLNTNRCGYSAQDQSPRVTQFEVSNPTQQHKHSLLASTQMEDVCFIGAPWDSTHLVPVDHVALINRAQQMVEMLLKENENLRKELDGHTEKSVKIQKLEREIQRISEAYENLMKASAKRETLEKTMRNKMEGEIRRLHDFNRDLREKLGSANRLLTSKECEVSDDGQSIVSKLIAQNREQQQEKEQLRRELSLSCSRYEDQQRRVQLLDHALNSTQSKVVRLEDELRKKRAYVQRVEKLQHALSQLQAACEKREQLELRLRKRLEQELKSLRTQQRQATAQGPGASECSVPALMELLREKEERILALEADMTKWEQKYLEESTMRQFAMDAAATAATQRDTTIINHSPHHSPNNSFNGSSLEKCVYYENSEVIVTNHRHQEMENRIKALHAQILEKDAIIKVLQQRSRKDQMKPEQLALRPARSVPSIALSTGTSLTSDRDDKAIHSSSGAVNKGYMEDQSVASDSHPAMSHTKHGSRDGSTQTEKIGEAIQSAPGGSQDNESSGSSWANKPMTSSVDLLETPNQVRLSTVKSQDSSDNEMVEILI